MYTWTVTRGDLSHLFRHERVGVLSAGDVDLRDFVQVRFVACAAALIAEEAVARALARSDAPSEQDEGALVRAG